MHILEQNERRNILSGALSVRYTVHKSKQVTTL